MDTFVAILGMSFWAFIIIGSITNAKPTESTTSTGDVVGFILLIMFFIAVGMMHS